MEQVASDILLADNQTAAVAGGIAEDGHDEMDHVLLFRLTIICAVVLVIFYAISGHIIEKAKVSYQYCN